MLKILKIKKTLVSQRRSANMRFSATANNSIGEYIDLSLNFKAEI